MMADRQEVHRGACKADGLKLGLGLGHLHRKAVERACSAGVVEAAGLR